MFVETILVAFVSALSVGKSRAFLPRDGFVQVIGQTTSGCPSPWIPRDWDGASVSEGWKARARLLLVVLSQRDGYSPLPRFDSEIGFPHHDARVGCLLLLRPRKYPVGHGRCVRSAQLGNRFPPVILCGVG